MRIPPGFHPTRAQVLDYTTASLHRVLEAVFADEASLRILVREAVGLDVADRRHPPQDRRAGHRPVRQRPRRRARRGRHPRRRRAARRRALRSGRRAEGGARRARTRPRDRSRRARRPGHAHEHVGASRRGGAVMVTTDRSDHFPPYELLDDWARRAERRRTASSASTTRRRRARGIRARCSTSWRRSTGASTCPRTSARRWGTSSPSSSGGSSRRGTSRRTSRASSPTWTPRWPPPARSFDEARHFSVLRDYFSRAKITVPPMNPFGRRVLVKILETHSVLEKLYGMQLLVENLALAIFKQVAASGIEPVLSELLEYVERDESRHVALGVLYLPKLLAKASAAEHAHNWMFNMELFLLTIGGGQLLESALQGARDRSPPARGHGAAPAHPGPPGHGRGERGRAGQAGSRCLRALGEAAAVDARLAAPGRNAVGEARPGPACLRPGHEDGRRLDVLSRHLRTAS